MKALIFVEPGRELTALTAALHLRKTGAVAEVIAVAVGVGSEEVLLGALARGAERALNVRCSGPPITCVPLAGLIDAFHFTKADLVLTGSEAIGQQLAGALGISRIAGAVTLKLEAGAVLAGRWVRGGQETLRAQLPAVISCADSFGQSPIPSLPEIIASRTRPIETLEAKLRFVSTKETSPTVEKASCVLLADSEEFFEALLRFLEPHEVIDQAPGATRLARVGFESGNAPLDQAPVVVTGGRCFRDAITYSQLVGGIAARFGGAVGATRETVDLGLAPRQLLIGPSGQSVAPELYLALGISGSTQHLAGMRRSRMIAAVNSDPTAPVFTVAHIGLIADAVQIAKELLEKFPATR